MEEHVTVDELGQLIKKMKVEGRASCTVADLLSNLRNLQVENSQDLNPPMFMFQDPGILRDKSSSSFSFASSVKEKESVVVDGLKKGLSRPTAENENPNNSPLNSDVSMNNSKHASSPWSAMSVESVSPIKPATSDVTQQDKEGDELPFLFSFNMGVSSSSSSSSQNINGNNFHVNQRNKGGKGLSPTHPGKPVEKSSVPGNNVFSHVNNFDLSTPSVETTDVPPTWWNPTHNPHHHNNAINGSHFDEYHENDVTHEEDNELGVLGRCHPGGTPIPPPSQLLTLYQKHLTSQQHTQTPYLQPVTVDTRPTGPFFGNARMISPKSLLVPKGGPIPVNETNMNVPPDIHHLRNEAAEAVMIEGTRNDDRQHSHEKSEKVSGEFLKSIFETLSARSSPGSGNISISMHSLTHSPIHPHTLISTYPHLTPIAIMSS